jgi:hypothetical protein
MKEKEGKEKQKRMEGRLTVIKRKSDKKKEGERER